MEEQIRIALLGCAKPRDEQSRKGYEEQIRHLKQVNTMQFVYYMAQELNNTDLDEAARHLAGVLFKNSVKSGEGNPFWFQFNQEQNEELKKMILVSLEDSSPNVRLAACSGVATVACLELPLNKWPEIIEFLWESSFSTDLKKKQSALKTLGYICEELESGVLNNEHTEKIISALIEAIKDQGQNEEIMKIAIEAVLHSLTFAESIFESGNGSIIVEGILGGGGYNAVSVGTYTMMCLAELVRLYYEYIHDFMPQIKDVTFEIMNSKADEEVKTLAIEVWCSVCEEEIYLKKRSPEKCKNYTNHVFGELLQLMLTLLNSCELDEEDDGDIWNTSTAAGGCLHLMAQNVGDEIVQQVISFVEEKIGGNAGWKDKYFGLLALGAILDGPSKENLIEVLSPAMNVILELYSDGSRKIRETAAWFFSKLAQNHAELIGTELFFPKLYEGVVRGLEDDIKVAGNSATIITELSKSLAPVEGQNRNILSFGYGELISKLLECAYRTDEPRHSYGRSENKIVIAGFDALYGLFEYAPPDVENLLLGFLEDFYKLLNDTNAGDSTVSLDDRSKDMQSFICVCIQTILNRIHDNLDKKIAKMLVDSIIDGFKRRGDVFEEGFLLMSALCSKFGTIMDDYANEIGPYIFHALKESDSSDTIKNACGLISDLCTMVESMNIISNFEEYVPLLHNIMINSKLQRDTKLGAVTAIGDTYLMTKDKFAPFLDNTLSLFSSAAEQGVDVNSNDVELIEYVIKLQGALIESYTCIIQEVAHSEQEAYHKLEQYVPGIIQFGIVCVSDKFSPNLGRIKEIAGLIGDLASTYQKKEYFVLPEIEDIVKFLQNSGDVEARTIAEWIINNITIIIQGQQ